MFFFKYYFIAFTWLLFYFRTKHHFQKLFESYDKFGRSELSINVSGKKLQDKINDKVNNSLHDHLTEFETTIEQIKETKSRKNFGEKNSDDFFKKVNLSEELREANKPLNQRTEASIKTFDIF